MNNASAVDRMLGLATTETVYGRVPSQAKRLVGIFMATPSLESWDAISGIVFKGRMTIWQAVCLLDPKFPTQARDADQNRPYPSAYTVARAIAEQVEDGIGAH